MSNETKSSDTLRLSGKPNANMRDDMRPEMREDDPRARAAKRAAELRLHGGDIPEGVDEFYVEPAKIPDGWSYEWKTRTVVGKEDPAYQVQLAQAGWEAVPASRHKEMMPKGFNGECIERKGMVLMERPLEITQDAKDKELRRARLQVRSKEEQLNAAPKGQFERSKSDGTSLAKVSKSYEPMAIPQ